MGRIRESIKVNGRQFWTMFDTGARNTYVVPAVAELLSTSKTPHPIRSALGGEVKQVNTTALLQAEVEGRPISTHALVVDRIGTDENGKTIEILFGALAMQQWGIRPVPDEQKLDLSHYPDEFVEFRSSIRSPGRGSAIREENGRTSRCSRRGNAAQRALTAETDN